jgi:putative GTP pyrophosphokinase
MDSKQYLPDKKAMQDDYNKFLPARKAIVQHLERSIEVLLQDLPSRVLVKGRLKSFESWHKKYINLLKLRPADKPFDAEGRPIITDIIGVRISCPFLEDLRFSETALRQGFEVTQVEHKNVHSYREFGYQSLHLLIKIPATLVAEHGDPGIDTAEIQIRSILQDAWAEVEHELVYKAEFTPFDEPLKRKLAAVNAMLTLADTIFQEIRSYQRQLHGQMDKRRGTFFQQIEDESDKKIFDAEQGPSLFDQGEAAPAEPVFNTDASTIDDLLLNALYAHNRGQLDDAIRIYTRILGMKPNQATASLIYKHRGMAYFALRRYDEAAQDFTASFENDAKSYKALYYRGVVHSVQARYGQAVDDFSQSLDVNPYQSFCLYRRAQVYYHLEDYPAALADCEASLKLENNNKSVETLRRILLNKLKM